MGKFRNRNNKTTKFPNQSYNPEKINPNKMEPKTPYCYQSLVIKNSSPIPPIASSPFLKLWIPFSNKCNAARRSYKLIYKSNIDGMFYAMAVKPPPFIICLNSIKLTLPSPSTSTFVIILLQSSIPFPCLSPSDSKTDLNSSTEMYPSPF